MSHATIFQECKWRNLTSIDFVYIELDNGSFLLFLQSGDQALCEDLVSSAVNWWQSNENSQLQSGMSSAAAAWCLDYLAGLKLKSGSTGQAVSTYQQVLDIPLPEVQRAEVGSLADLSQLLELKH